MSVLVLGTDNSDARAGRRCLVGSARLVRLLKYAGADVTIDLVRENGGLVRDALPHCSAAPHHACLAASGATAEEVWRQIDHHDSRRLSPRCSALVVAC